MPIESAPPGKHGSGPTYSPPDPNAPQPAGAVLTPLGPAETLKAEIKAAHEDYGVRVAGMGMSVSATGRAWTEHCEGCRLTAYPDNGAYSIGYGHRGVPPGASCTQAEAEAWLDADLAHTCGVIANAVKVDLTQGQIDALADFIFNEGGGHFRESTILRLLNLGDYDRVPDELLRWIYAAGEPNEGLKARREGEVILWQGGNPLEPTEAIQAVS